MADQLLVGESGQEHVPAVRGSGVTVGVEGRAKDGWGVNGHSAKQVGVRGYCDDGWGVAGESKTQVGVRGYCEPGWGVAGSSKSGLGVLGECDTGAGVMGASKSADGVFGKSESGRGVVGVAVTATAVEGTTESGVAMYATSETHIGVYAKGGHLAALLDGDVDVNGDLRVSGTSILSLLQRLVAVEEALVGLTNSTVPTPSTGGPSISVSTEASGSSSVFLISGTGFQPNKPVRIRVRFQDLSGTDFEHTADATGSFKYRQPFACVSGLVMHFSATDGRPAGSDVLWSNTFTTVCP